MIAAAARDSVAVRCGIPIASDILAARPIGYVFALQIPGACRDDVAAAYLRSAFTRRSLNIAPTHWAEAIQVVVPDAAIAHCRASAHGLRPAVPLSRHSVSGNI